MDPLLRRRLDLQTILESFLPEIKRAYFQPPENIMMQYPCIVYQRDYVLVQYADNSPYKRKKRYQVTVIDQDPDSEIPDKVAAMPYSSFQRGFVADNLNHTIYIVYF